MDYIHFHQCAVVPTIPARVGFGLLEATRRSSEGDSFEDVHVAEESGNTIVFSRDQTPFSLHSSQL